jgi:branched-chain amino acid transport system ATP-binding protein
MSLLEITDLSHNFGGLRALSNFSLEVKERELVGLIGPNGAGKTTIFNLITGLFKVSQGTIKFQGQDITRWPSHRISAGGIARTFQNIRLFKELSVIDNVRLGGYAQHAYSLLDAMARSKNFQTEEERQRQRAYELLARFNLTPYADAPARNLPYGEQRRVEMARALISGPKLLLLDEPAAGMNQSEVQDLIRLILEIKKEFSLTIILIEHQMRVVQNLCQWVKVLDFGETIASGPPREIQSHPAVQAAYLGSDGTLVEEEVEEAATAT